jgi:hypothetical protein
VPRWFLGAWAESASSGWVLNRLLVDLWSDGRVSVSSWFEGVLPEGPAAEPFALVWPVDGEDLESLSCYLEDYLRAPFAVYGERGPRVERALLRWRSLRVLPPL